MLVINAGPVALALLIGLGQAGCNQKASGKDDAAPARVDSEVETGSADTTTPRPIADTAAGPTADTQAVPKPPDSVALPGPDTSAATPPITPAPSQGRSDPASSGAANPGEPSNQAASGGEVKVSQIDYEGWRQYSVNCARCHGQDVLPNPVAANLLISLGPGGPIDTPEKFFQAVNEGRPDRGMPAFKSLLTPEQIKAIYAYVKGRAEKRIPPGRPARPA
jgi:mono/diheme cytochrome c family protein